MKTMLYILIVASILTGCAQSAKNQYLKLCDSAGLEYGTAECEQYITEFNQKLEQERQEQIKARNTIWCNEVGLEISSSECAQYVANKESQIMQQMLLQQQVEQMNVSNQIQYRAMKCQNLPAVNPGYGGSWANSFMRGFYGC